MQSIHEEESAVGLAVFFGWMFLFALVIWVSVVSINDGWSNEWLEELGDVSGVASGTAILKTLAMAVVMLAAFKRRKVRKERDQEILNEARISGEVNIGGKLVTVIIKGDSTDTDSQTETNK